MTRLLATVASLLAAGCALVPQPNVRLDEAQAAIRAMSHQPDVARLAPQEAHTATQALQRAEEAWQTLQDPALVDHLAYVAKQRAAIAAATAQARRAAGR